MYSLRDTFVNTKNILLYITLKLPVFTSFFGVSSNRKRGENIKDTL